MSCNDFHLAFSLFSMQGYNVDPHPPPSHPPGWRHMVLHPQLSLHHPPFPFQYHHTLQQAATPPSHTEGGTAAIRRVTLRPFPTTPPATFLRPLGVLFPCWRDWKEVQFLSPPPFPPPNQQWAFFCLSWRVNHGQYAVLTEDSTTPLSFWWVLTLTILEV